MLELRNTLIQKTIDRVGRHFMQCIDFVGPIKIHTPIAIYYSCIDCTNIVSLVKKLVNALFVVCL